MGADPSRGGPTPPRRERASRIRDVKTTEVRPYRKGDEEALVALWQRCGLTRPWNDPWRDIDRKMAWDGERLVVADRGGVLVGSVMVGYDGHRGWLYYLAVHPDWQGAGLGRRLVDDALELLRALGCAKVNLQVRRSNLEAIGFYERVGFLEDDVVSFGKRLVRDEPGEA